MTQITVHHNDTPEGGRYSVTLPGIANEAWLSWLDKDGVIEADHTFAPDSMRGMGVALAMVQRLVADARARKQRIRPVCPYVRAQFDRHPEWADLRAPIAEHPSGIE